MDLNSKVITNLADPSGDNDAANKKYVDTKPLNTFQVPDDRVDFNNKLIKNLADPVDNKDAANKEYVDTKPLNTF